VATVKPLSPHLWRQKECGWTPLLYSINDIFYNFDSKHAKTGKSS
jgi:hypothetical protein